MKILVINGPNLNLLGSRDQDMYGATTLDQIEVQLTQRARDIGIDILFFQSNSEGSIIDHIQEASGYINGIIINPGALTHYGISLRGALSDTNLPVIEVHISNIYARETWRHNSYVAPISVGQISGLGWRGYLFALNFLAERLSEQQ